MGESIVYSASSLSLPATGRAPEFAKVFVIYALSGQLALAPV
jgi:hypothetical protein